VHPHALFAEGLNKAEFARYYERVGPDDAAACARPARAHAVFPGLSARRRPRTLCCADATRSIDLSDNETVRLIHRERPRDDSLEEGECYDHSYGKHVSDHVEIVPLESAGIRVDIPVEVETKPHVTTECLKRQFEDRLAARTRRSRRARP
jgi:hypothetical protein